MRNKYHQYGGNPFDDGCVANCKAFCFGGSSRVLRRQDQVYREEEVDKLEPNIFIIHKKDKTQEEKDEEAL